MRHVFFIHSHVTWLVSLAVIDHHQLTAGDVLLVCARGYEPPDHAFATKAFPERRWVITWRLLQWWRQHRELTRFVDEVSGGRDFAWYLPHRAFPFFNAFVRHPRCRGYHLIEEGMASYHTPESIARVLRGVVAARPGWRGWVARGFVTVRPPVFADERCLAFYGCTDEAFPGYPRKVRVQVRALAPAEAADIDTVLVFDATLEAQLADEAPYHACLQELLAILARQGRRTVHYKLAPSQYVDRRYSPRVQQALRENTHGIRFVELPASCSLEMLALAGRADFFTFLSSVGIYAANAGCGVYSMAQRLAQLDPRYRPFPETIPEGVRRKFQFL